MKYWEVVESDGINSYVRTDWDAGKAQVWVSGTGWVDDPEYIKDVYINGDGTPRTESYVLAAIEQLIAA